MGTSRLGLVSSERSEIRIMESLHNFTAWAACASLDELESRGCGMVYPALARDLTAALALPSRLLQASMLANCNEASSTQPTGAEWRVLGLARLLGIADDIVSRSTAPQAKTFDVGLWLGEWVRRPQPALGEQRPLDMLCTRAGVAAAARVLGAIESGAYQ